MDTECARPKNYIRRIEATPWRLRTFFCGPGLHSIPDRNRMSLQLNSEACPGSLSREGTIGTAGLVPARQRPCWAHKHKPRTHSCDSGDLKKTTTASHSAVSQEEGVTRRSLSSLDPCRQCCARAGHCRYRFWPRRRGDHGTVGDNDNAVHFAFVFLQWGLVSGCAII